MRLTLSGFLKCSAAQPISFKISLKFTDKALIFDDLSVSKTHFTDKPAFSSDLSVNFCPLYWGFTDKSRFLEHLSVKPGPKRLNFYGQTAVFAHFVRNRHFSSRPFTDRKPIFIDVSVNGRTFAKCSACPPETSRRDYGQLAVWGLFVRNSAKISLKFTAKLFLVISKYQNVPYGTANWHLRANPRNRCFARNRMACFTGRSQK